MKKKLRGKLRNGRGQQQVRRRQLQQRRQLQGQGQGQGKQQPRQTSLAAKFDLGFRSPWAVTMAGGKAAVERDIFVGIRGERIAAVRPAQATDSRLCKKFFAKNGMVLLPGLINAHTHLPMTLLRGLAEDLPLEAWLHDKIFPYEALMLSPASVRLGTQLAALECVRFGTTTVNDMYYFVAQECEVWDSVGLRGVFAQQFFANPTPETLALGADYEAEFWRLHRKYANHPRIRIGVAPHAVYTCDEKVLRQAVSLAKKAGVPLQIHAAETEAEVSLSISRYGMRPVEYLHHLGFWSPQTVCVHGIHVTPQEIEMLRQSGAGVVYNPDSNAKLASGVARVPEMMALSIPVALGTDGSVSKNDLSLFSAMNVGAKLQKLFHQDPALVKAAEILRMATWDGARALGMADQIGSIEEGKLADLIWVDFQYPHLQPVNDVISHLVFSCQGLEVDTVVCHGRVLLKEKKWTTIDASDVFARVEAFRKRVKPKLT
ncbi:MAG: S-adenosylhomocysteine deaminase [Bdellovibrio sp.]|nr:MAG: S-adenosylhomocysteine deaminase [Bdellovibrio sp.]